MVRKVTKTTTTTLFSFSDLVELEKANQDKKRACEKAREWLQKGATDYDWYDYTIELWVKALGQVGFEDAEIRFTGFWSQGDGASFHGDIDIRLLIAFLSDTTTEPKAQIGYDEEKKEELCIPWVMDKLGWMPAKHGNPKLKHLLKIADEYITQAQVERGSSNYCHESTCSVTMDWDLPGDSGQDEKGNWFWDCKHKRINALLDDLRGSAETLRYDLSRVIYRELEAEHEWLQSDEALIESAAANDWEFDESGDVVYGFEHDDVPHEPIRILSKLERELHRLTKVRRRKIGKLKKR
jgi:hypothetical protein